MCHTSCIMSLADRSKPTSHTGAKVSGSHPSIDDSCVFKPMECQHIRCFLLVDVLKNLADQLVMFFFCVVKKLKWTAVKMTWNIELPVCYWCRVNFLLAL